MGEVEYESPRLTVIGSVSELTESDVPGHINKDKGMSDSGVTFQNQPTSITP